MVIGFFIIHTHTHTQAARALLLHLLEFDNRCKCSSASMPRVTTADTFAAVLLAVTRNETTERRQCVAVLCRVSDKLSIYFDEWCSLAGDCQWCSRCQPHCDVTNSINARIIFSFFLLLCDIEYVVCVDFDPFLFLWNDIFFYGNVSIGRCTVHTPLPAVEWKVIKFYCPWFLMDWVLLLATQQYAFGQHCYAIWNAKNKQKCVRLRQP